MAALSPRRRLPSIVVSSDDPPETETHAHEAYSHQPQHQHQPQSQPQSQSQAQPQPQEGQRQPPPQESQRQQQQQPSSHHRHRRRQRKHSEAASDKGTGAAAAEAAGEPVFVSLSSERLGRRRSSVPAHPAGVKTPAAIVEWARATSSAHNSAAAPPPGSAPGSRPSSAGSVAVVAPAAAPQGLQPPVHHRSGSWSSNASETSEFLTEEEVEEELSCLSSMAGDPHPPMHDRRYGGNGDAAAHLLNSPLTLVSLHQAEVHPDDVANADAGAMAAAAAANFASMTGQGAAGGSSSSMGPGGAMRRGSLPEMHSGAHGSSGAKRRNSAAWLAPSQGRGGVSPSSAASDASHELAPSHETMVAAARAGVDLEPIYPLASKQRREMASLAAKRARRSEDGSNKEDDSSTADAAAALAASRLKGKRGRRRKEELERMGEAERKREESIKMQRNRLSARECRKRKKAYIDSLETRVAQLEDIIQKLVAENDRLNSTLLTHDHHVSYPVSESHAMPMSHAPPMSHHRTGTDVSALLQSAGGSDPALTQQLLSAIMNHHSMPM